MRLLGFGVVFDQLEYRTKAITNNAVVNTAKFAEEHSYRDKKIEGTWKAQNCSIDGREDAEVTIKLYPDNSYAERIKSKDEVKDTVKRGTYYAKDNQISLIPNYYKDKGQEIALNALINHADRYGEGFTYQLKDNKLELINSKTNETIVLEKVVSKKMGR